MAKVRVDVALVERGLADTREQAQRLVSAGRVRSGTLTFVKASQMVAEDAELSVSEPERYVSRGGLKLEGALSAFGVDPAGRVCLDLGASTGGFTDCLLQHGASRVIAVDVGRAQLHQRLREDLRVVLLEQTNARDLPELERNEEREKRKEQDEGEGEGTFILDPSSFISLFVADLSFISLRKVLPSVASRLGPGTEGVVLLKPQFEAGPKDVPRGGVIKDEAVLERVRREFVEWLEGNGWPLYGMIASPIRGGDGNTEYLVHVRTPGGPEGPVHGDTESFE
ncbi:TlyA family RNA methyltransferase [Candidatus Amarobacter glycogenicus]|uniref:TlyA family RNA methyltransferase n=1 Tax=Candidatus Amarobacter glycogenicus TaxID=3140699 RepID=UPI003136BA4C|nr:TlyA family RNA methyltransferase [Dehalococcoidia bacterium]